MPSLWLARVNPARAVERALDGLILSEQLVFLELHHQLDALERRGDGLGDRAADAAEEEPSRCTISQEVRERARHDAADDAPRDAQRRGAAGEGDLGGPVAWHLRARETGATRERQPCRRSKAKMNESACRIQTV